MTVIKLADSATGKVLASRPSARAFFPTIEEALNPRPETLTFDFEGIRVVAPSFLDELLLQTEKAAIGHQLPKLVIRAYPAGMDETVAAIGRAHETDVVLDDLGSWVLTKSA